MKISKSSIISEGAKIANNVSIGDFCYIGPNVSINENSKIMSHVHISGDTTIGTGNIIYPFASIGTDPQDLKFKGEKNKLIIGNNNKIREYVTINPGTEHGGGVTKIGNNCLLMISSHIAHDCVVADNVIIANNVPIAGHCIIENDVIIGGNSAVQQFCNIGKGAMIGGMTGVNKNVLPYTLVTGNRCTYENLNLIGLKRKNFNNSTITEYKKFIESKNFNNSEFENNDNSLILEAKQFLKKNINKLICIPD
jgi:UDP-N-acetylglucosamine acyltransferase